MPKCASIDPLVTPYVDGDLDAGSRWLVDEHVRVCPPCHSRVEAERAVRELMHARRAEIASQTPASAVLRQRITTLGEAVSRERFAAGRPGRPRLSFAPLAVAASLVVVGGGAFLYEFSDRSTRLLAAELTADHVKCFGIEAVVGMDHDPAAVEATMVSAFGWHPRLPDSAARAGLELVGARLCLYARGKTAHIMYRHNGRPVSVFMIPNTTGPPVNDANRPEVVEVLGHEACIWTAGRRTFVLIAREPEAEVAQVASLVQSALR